MGDLSETFSLRQIHAKPSLFCWANSLKGSEIRQQNQQTVEIN
jgi:hypothetical protein